MLVLAAVARQRGHEVRDRRRQGQRQHARADVAQQVVAFRPDVVRRLGDDDLGHQRRAHRRSCQGSAAPIVTVVGGPHVSAIPERTLAALPRVRLRHRRRGRDLVLRSPRRASSGAAGRDVPGLVYRANGTVRPPIRAPVHRRSRRAAACRPGTWCRDFPHRFQPSMFNYRATPVATLVTLARLSVLVHVLRPLHLGQARPLSQRRVRVRMCRTWSDARRAPHPLLRRPLHGEAQARRRALRGVPRRGLPLHVELQQPSEPARPRRR